jgi:hypothetical protein
MRSNRISLPAKAAFPLIAIHRVAIEIIIAADLCFSSRLYMGVLPDFAQRILLSTLLLLSSFYIGIAVLRGHMVPVLLAALAIGLVVGQIIVYDLNWGMEPNWTGAGQFSVFLTFVPFFIMSRDGLAPYLARRLAFYAMFYVFLYTGFVIAYRFGIVPRRIAEPLMMNDAERGERFFAYIGALAFAWYVSLGRVRDRASVYSVLMLFACALANLLTLSRVYLVCLVAVTSISLLQPPRWLIQTVCLGILVTISSVLLYGMVDTRWNPFFAFASGDNSGLGRALEYQVAQDLLARSPFFGLGLASSGEMPARLTGISFFSPGDLGAAGVWLDLGIFGLGLFLVSSIIACSRIHMLPNQSAEALFLNGCTLALYGSIAPVLFAPGGTFYFAAILGMWLAQEIRMVSPRPAASKTANQRTTTLNSGLGEVGMALDHEP